MKKIIATLLVCFSTLTSWANTQTVQVVWPFAPGSTQAVMIRSLIESANQQQNQYQFVFVSKPGAGGAIAANYVLTSPTLTVLASSSSFYSRPMMYSESHDPEQFKMIGAVCMHSPLALFSRKYSTIKDLKNKDATVGINPGSVTQLLTRLLATNNPELKFTDVPYKGTPEATTDMLARHIDASVDLLSTGNLARLTTDTSVIGITGTRSFPNMPSFNSLKIKGLEHLTNSYYLFATKNIDPVILQDLNRLFNSAINDAVREGCSNERGVVEIIPADRTDTTHRATLKQWQQLTQGVAKQ